MAYEGQFVKISNRLIRNWTKEGNLERLGAYSLLSYFLQLPHAPRGGIRNAMYLHTSDGMYTVNHCMHDLQESGFLLRNRLVNGQQFTDCYLLREETEGEVDRNSIRATKVCSPTSDFVMAPLSVLMDEQISLAAKGLYLCIRRQVDMMQHGVEIHLTKKYLRAACHKGEQSFDRIWNQLKNGGYLSLQRRWNPEYRVSDCEITLSDTASNITPNEESPQANRSEDSFQPKTATQVPENPPAETNAISSKQPSLKKSTAPVSLASVQKQMGYDELLTKYPEEAALLARVILEVYRTPSDKPFTVSGKTVPAEQIQTALRALSRDSFAALLESYRHAAQKSTIQHPERYLTASLLRFSLSPPTIAPSSAPTQPLSYMENPSYSLDDFLDFLSR